MLILTTFVCIPISYVETEKKIICFVSWSLLKQEFMVYLFVCKIDSSVVTLEESGKFVGMCNDIAERRAVCDLKAFHSKMQKEL